MTPTLDRLEALVVRFLRFSRGETEETNEATALMEAELTDVCAQLRAFLPGEGALATYRDVGYLYMLMPDHVPRIDGRDPSGVGFAYCYGYIQGLIDALG